MFKLLLKVSLIGLFSGLISYKSPAQNSIHRSIASQLNRLDSLGNHYRIVSFHVDSSSFFYHQKLLLAQKHKLKSSEGFAYFDLAFNQYFYKRDIDSTLRLATCILPLAEAEKSNHLKSKYFYLLSLATFKLGETQEMFKHLKQTIALANQTDDDEWKGKCYATAAVFSSQLSHFDYAESCYQQCLKIYEKVNLDEWFSHGLDYCDFLERHRNQKPYWLYLKLKKKKDDLKRSLGDYVYFNDLARLATKLKQFSKAEKYIFQSIQTKNHAYTDTLRLFHAYKHLVELYEASNNTTKQLTALKKFHELDTYISRKTITENSKIQLLKISSQLDLEKKEHQIENLKNTQKIHRTYLLLAVGLVIALLIFLWTLQKSNQKIAQQKEELLRLNATKDRLFTILSHDLRSPIANLQTFMNLINWGALSQKEFSDSIQLFDLQIRQVNQMMENLLHWSLSQMGGIRPRKTKTYLAQVTEEQIQILKPTALKKNITIQNKIDTSIHTFLDPQHLAIILRNLMQNAIKFTFPDGIIEIQAEEKNKKMYLTITDPGLGIPEDVLATLFQPSKESKRLGTAQEQGTGIGLVLVKDLVEANDGQISITSQQGTVCTLIFPMME